MYEELESYLNKEYFKFAQKKGRLTSAADFAKWLGVSNTSLSQWMNGHRAPTGKNVHKIAAKLGPEIYDILGLPRSMPDDPGFDYVAKRWFEMNEEQKKLHKEFIDELMEDEAEELGLETA